MTVPDIQLINYRAVPDLNLFLLHGVIFNLSLPIPSFPIPYHSTHKWYFCRWYWYTLSTLLPYSHSGACVLSRFSCVWLCATLWTVALQAPLSMGFSSKNTRVGCYALLQEIFRTQRSKACLLHLLHWQVDSLPLALPRSLLPFAELTCKTFSWSCCSLFPFTLLPTSLCRIPALFMAFLWTKSPVVSFCQ